MFQLWRVVFAGPLLESRSDPSLCRSVFDVTSHSRLTDTTSLFNLIQQSQFDFLRISSADSNRLRWVIVLTSIQGPFDFRPRIEFLAGHLQLHHRLNVLLTAPRRSPTIGQAPPRRVISAVKMTRRAKLSTSERLNGIKTGARA